MIETKEEYAQTWALINGQDRQVAKDFHATIEALRDVARAAENALNYDNTRGVWTLSDDEAQDMQEAYARIPNWITDDD